MNANTVYEITTQQMVRSLQGLSGCLEKANHHALERKISFEVLLQARLIADQFPLVRQIQSTCDVAKLCASRLSGKQAPVDPDTEKTFEQVQMRIAKTTTYLESFTENDFAQFEQKKAQFPWYPGHFLEGKDYFEQFVIPNFYFHLTTAYSIMRANGVLLGKADFLSSLPFKKL